jgi:GTP-binding protein EngB required for normal cell division
MSTPTENINICFVGGVSTGKSTALNSIFGKKLTQCHFKRTTMIPTVYVENPSEISDTDTIYQQISQKNAELIEKTENGKKVSKEDYAEMVFNVGKLDIDIVEDSFVNVYDIPGLNDPRTKSIYYDYLDTNFHKFNIVVFFIDIRSGLNTSDEFDILDFITTHTRFLKDRPIYTLVVVNKADDMQLDSDDNVTVTGELKEMFDYVHQTVTTEFRKRAVFDRLIGIIPLCAIDAYLYRMIQKFGENFELTPEQILKIGVNENGKKFSTHNPEKQRELVGEILRDETFIETMIRLSGFSQFERILRRFLSVESKKIRTENILYERKHLPTITRETFQTVKTARHAIILYMRIYNRIREVDNQIFEQVMGEFSELIISLLETEIRNTNTVHGVLTYYDDFVATIITPFFSKYYETSVYSQCVQQHVKKLLLESFDKSLSSADIVNACNTLKRVGIFCCIEIDALFARLLKNPRKQNTVNAFNDNDAELIAILHDCSNEGYDCTKILRFLIINKLELEPSTLYTRYLIYRVQREVSISEYIRISMPQPTIEMVVNGLSQTETTDPMFALDFYYLGYSS